MSSEMIEEVREMHPYKVAGDYDTYSKYNEGWEDACDELAARIADPWISVDDRLPEPNSEVIGHIEFGCEYTIETVEYEGVVNGNHSFAGVDYLLNRKVVDYAITHWMPLPKPPTND